MGTDLELAKRELGDAEALVCNSAQKLSNRCQRDGRYSVIVQPADLDDLREKLRRRDKAMEAYLKACAQTPPRDPSLPEVLYHSNGDPDDNAIAYAVLMHRGGGEPEISVLFSGDRIVGIRVRDTSSPESARALTKDFGCRPFEFSDERMLDMLNEAYQREIRR